VCLQDKGAGALSLRIVMQSNAVSMQGEDKATPVPRLLAG